MDPPQWNYFQPPVSEQPIVDCNRSFNSLSQSYSNNFSSQSNTGSRYGTGNLYDQSSNSYTGTGMRSSNKQIPYMTPSSLSSPSTQYSGTSYSSYMNSNNGSGQYSQSCNTFRNSEAPQSSTSTNYYSGSQYTPPTPPISDFKIGTFTLNANGYASESNTSNETSNSNSQSSNSYQASNSSTSAANQSVRETGIIEKLLQTYGFIQCCERQARLFFHFSQFDGNTDHLRIGDPVEFEVTFDRRTGKPIASSVTKISPEVVLSEERVIGIVTTELKSENGGEQQGRITYENRGECFFLPYSKEDVEGYVTLKPRDKVSFQIATNQRRNGNLAARHVRLENPAEPVKYQGVVSAIKDSYGFIERADVVDEIFFHFSEAKTIPEGLKLGDDVEFLIQSRNSKEVATNMVRLPTGTVVFEDINQDEIRGQVLKPVEKNLRQTQKDPLTGRIRYRGKDRSEVEVKFGERDQKADFTLRHGDWVKFNIATDRRDNLQKATNISLLDESFQVSGEKREEGAIHSLKDGYGYIKCADRDARMYFQFNELLDPQWKISVNDEIEFTVVSDSTIPAPKRQSATRIRKLPNGTVKFEILIQENLEGEVTLEPNSIPPSPTFDNSEMTVQPGIIAFFIEAVKQTINFYPNESAVTPRLGDRVQFSMFLVKCTKERVALNINILPPIMNSVTLGRQSMVGSGRTFDRGSTNASTLTYNVMDPFKLRSLSQGSSRKFTRENQVSGRSFSEDGDEIVRDFSREKNDLHDIGLLKESNETSEEFSRESKDISDEIIEEDKVVFDEYSREDDDSSREFTRENDSREITREKKDTQREFYRENKVITRENSIPVTSPTTSMISVVVDDLIDLSEQTPTKKPLQNDTPTPHPETKPLVPERSSPLRQIGKTLSGSSSSYNSRPIPIHQGYIATLKETFGFIENINHDKEIFFHFSNAETNINDLDLGHEVEYSISSRTGPGGKLSAENVRVLPVGSITTPKILGEVFEGTVLRSMRSVNPDQQEYCGQVCVGKEDEKLGRHQFGITGLVNKKELLQPGDSAHFQLDEDGWAVNIRAVRKKLLAIVEAVKGQYGFLNYENEKGKKLFFHQSEVKDGITLTQGDEVQFVIITNLKTGKSSACNITRLLSSSGPSQRPDRLVSRLKGLSKDTSKPRIEVIRQPKGPDGTKGFKMQRVFS